MRFHLDNPYNIFLVLLNAELLYIELEPNNINKGDPIGIELVYKPRNINSNGNELSPIDFEIYFIAGAGPGQRKKLEDLYKSINPQN